MLRDSWSEAERAAVTDDEIVETGSDFARRDDVGGVGQCAPLVGILRPGCFMNLPPQSGAGVKALR
jgi:hypothetical protein